MVKKIGLAIISVILILVGGVLIYNGLIKPKTPKRQEFADLKSLAYGEVFENGSYIDIDDVRISYNGEYFEVSNNRSDMVRVLCSVVGVKKDGSYDTIQMVSFGGTDETLYKREKSENGWAIKQFTNLVRPSETLNAKMEIFEFNDVNSEYPQNDIDGDGYFDIVFTISPQLDEKTITTASTDIISDIYKIKAN